MSGSLALIDYGAGNLRSVENALRTAGATAVAVTADPETVRKADRIVLPGVGAFGHCRDQLAAIPGMIEALDERVQRGGIPFLGICVGMQLMAARGEEHGVHQGLGWIAGTVREIPAGPSIRIPHMGWNDVVPTPGAPLVEPGEAYYLHSYHFVADNAADVLATSSHGGQIVAAVGRGNMIGVQFHPEKSQAYGLALLARFLEWKP